MSPISANEKPRGLVSDVAKPLLSCESGHLDAANTEEGKGTMSRYRSGGTPWYRIVDPQGRAVFNGFQLNAHAAIAHIRQQLKA